MWSVPELRVLSYNVRSLRDDRGALVDVVRQCRPDVLVVQEAPRHVRWRAKCAGLARECGLLYVAGGRTAGGNLLLASHRVSVHQVSEYRIPQRLRQPIRGVVAATLGVGESRFGAVGMHLGLAAAGRAREVGEVLAAVRSLGDHPVVVAGDLNEAPSGPSWQAFATAGLRDVGGDGAEATFPAVGPRARIDAILLGGRPVKVHDEGIPDEPALRDAIARASDHVPVLAVIDLP